MARLFGDYFSEITDHSYEALMYKSSDIIILAAPLVPLSRGLTVSLSFDAVLKLQFTILSV